MPVRAHRVHRPPAEAVDPVGSYLFSDGTGDSLLDPGYADAWTAKAAWPEYRASVWARWTSRETPPYPPGGAIAHDHIGKALSVLLDVIPGEGRPAELLQAAAAADVAALKAYRRPTDVREPLKLYASSLTSFAAWVDKQSGMVSADDLINVWH